MTGVFASVLAVLTGGNDGVLVPGAIVVVGFGESSLIIFYLEFHRIEDVAFFGCGQME